MVWTPGHSCVVEHSARFDGVKPASIRPLSEDGLIERAVYYSDAGGPDLASRFFDAAIEAIRSAEAMPGIGSLAVDEFIGIQGCVGSGWRASCAPGSTWIVTRIGGR